MEIANRIYFHGRQTVSPIYTRVDPKIFGPLFCFNPKITNQNVSHFHFILLSQNHDHVQANMNDSPTKYQSSSNFFGLLCHKYFLFDEWDLRHWIFSSFNSVVLNHRPLIPDEMPGERIKIMGSWNHLFFLTLAPKEFLTHVGSVIDNED